MTENQRIDSDELLILVDSGKQSDEIVVVRLEGILDTTTAPILEDAFEELQEAQRMNVAVDLSKVSYISSAGWGVFVGELRRFRNNDGDIILAGMSREVREVYNLLELHAILQSFNDVETAIAAFKSNPIVRDHLLDSS